MPLYFSHHVLFLRSASSAGLERAYGRYFNQTIGNLELADLQINNALKSKTNREQLLSLRSKKNKLETEILNHNKIKSSLNIRAPFNAEITFLEKFKKDQWVNQEDPLLSLVDKDTQTIFAFISEKNIDNMIGDYNLTNSDSLEEYKTKIEKMYLTVTTTSDNE